MDRIAFALFCLVCCVVCFEDYYDDDYYEEGRSKHVSKNISTHKRNVLNATKHVSNKHPKNSTSEQSSKHIHRRNNQTTKRHNRGAVKIAEKLNKRDKIGRRKQKEKTRKAAKRTDVSKRHKDHRATKKTEMFIVDESQLDDQQDPDGQYEQDGDFDSENNSQQQPRQRQESTVTGDRKGFVNRQMTEDFQSSPMEEFTSSFEKAPEEENDDVINEGLNEEGLSTPYMESNQLIKANQLRGNYLPLKEAKSIQQQQQIQSPLDEVEKDLDTSNVFDNEVKKATSKAKIDSSVQEQIFEDIAKDAELREEYARNVTNMDLEVENVGTDDVDSPSSIGQPQRQEASKPVMPMKQPEKIVPPETEINTEVSKQINDDLAKDMALANKYSSDKKLGELSDSEISTTLDSMDKNPHFADNDLQSLISSNKTASTKTKTTKPRKTKGFKKKHPPKSESSGSSRSGEKSYSYLHLPAPTSKKSKKKLFFTSQDATDDDSNDKQTTTAVGDFASIVEKANKVNDTQQTSESDVASVTSIKQSERNDAITTTGQTSGRPKASVTEIQTPTEIPPEVVDYIKTPTETDVELKNSKLTLNNIFSPTPSSLGTLAKPTDQENGYFQQQQKPYFQQKPLDPNAEVKYAQNIDPNYEQSQQPKYVPYFPHPRPHPKNSNSDMPTEILMPMKEDLSDRTVAPSEQLLEMLSKGKFTRPLSEHELAKLSEFDPNKQFLQEQHINPNDVLQTHFTRVGAEYVPIRNVGLNLGQNGAPSRPLISKKQLSKVEKLIKTDPAFLGQNQQRLDARNFKTMEDLNTIGPGIIHAHVVNLKQFPTRQYPAKSHQQQQKFPLVSSHVQQTAGSASLPAFSPTHPSTAGNTEQRVFEDALVAPAFNNDVEAAHKTQTPTLTAVFSAQPFQQKYKPIEQPIKKTHNPCHITPCHNGGQCTIHPHGYRCSCKLGWNGENCQFRSSCSPNPCRHGTCYPDAEGHTCTCKLGYKGQQCDVVDKCQPNPCKNKGVCTEMSHKPQCECQSGFKSAFCELEAKCSPINPCLNGGVCKEMFDHYQCKCSSLFRGQNCEEIVTPTKEPPTTPLKSAYPQAIPSPESTPAPGYRVHTEGPEFTGSSISMAVVQNGSEGPLSKDSDEVLKEINQQRKAYQGDNQAAGNSEGKTPNNKVGILPNSQLGHENTQSVEVSKSDNKDGKLQNGDQMQQISESLNNLISSNQTAINSDNALDNSSALKNTPSDNVFNNTENNPENPTKPLTDTGKEFTLPDTGTFKETITEGGTLVDKLLPTKSSVPEAKPLVDNFANDTQKDSFKASSDEKFDKAPIEGSRGENEAYKTSDDENRKNAPEAQNATIDRNNDAKVSPTVEQQNNFKAAPTVDVLTMYHNASREQSSQDELKYRSREGRPGPLSNPHPPADNDLVSTKASSPFYGNTPSSKGNSDSRSNFDARNSPDEQTYSSISNTEPTYRYRSDEQRRFSGGKQEEQGFKASVGRRYDENGSQRSVVDRSKPFRDTMRAYSRTRVRLSPTEYSFYKRGKNSKLNTNNNFNINTNNKQYYQRKGNTNNRQYNTAVRKTAKQSPATQKNSTKNILLYRKVYSGGVTPMCPAFCKMFCDPWCVKVRCCRSTPEQLKMFKRIETAHTAPEYKAIEEKVCSSCNENADCLDGRCVCKTGFHGDGVNCAVDNCLLCHLDAYCDNLKCVCKRGFHGDGYTCKRMPSASSPGQSKPTECRDCHVDAQCTSGRCRCKRGYLGNGKGCWPLPIIK